MAILEFLQQGAMAVGPFVLLLGLLVFVHELGHFAVAKFFGVRVEVFSLGFGKKLLQVKRGDTVYCVSAIPLGGYVKMFGDDPSKEIAQDERSFSFTHKPVYQRFLVVLAGPAMNFFFAILVFATMAWVGEPALSPVLGDIETDSAAYRYGFRPGDRIMMVEKRPIVFWDDVQRAMEDASGTELEFTVLRQGENLTIKATPLRMRNKNLLSAKSWVGDVEGFAVQSRAPVIAVPPGSSKAYQAGLRTGDQVTALQGKKISNWRELRSQWDELATGPVLIEVSRPSAEGESVDTHKIQLMPDKVSERLDWTAAGLDSPELYVHDVLPGTPAEKAGLKKGDRILQVSGKNLDRWEDLVREVKSYDPSRQSLEMKLRRDEEVLSIQVIPQLTKQMNLQGQEEERFTIGVAPTIYSVSAEPLQRRATGLWSGLSRGFELTLNWTEYTAMGFVRLVQREVSPKSIGGVISIGQVASRSFAVGLAAFLSVMGIISVNLCVVNLLPVPVLDGGHLLFYTIEGLRGRPMNMRQMEIAQQMGLFLLLSLMAFALFNDFTRVLRLNW